jgi:limonene 1,2-monooxygenase
VDRRAPFGFGTIGTPDDAGEQIERLWKQSNGGFGVYLQLAHDWAPPDRKARSFELFARHVMPEFQGQADSTRQSAARAQAVRPEMAGSNMAAVAASIEKYQAELQAKS